MKKFYNQETRKIEELKEYKVYTYVLDIPNTYGLSYYKSLDESMQKFFAAIEPTNEPILFKIIGDFSLLKNVKDQDKMYFILAVTNIYASFFFTKERTETEYRLTAPKNIDHIKLNAMVKKDLVNKKMKYTCVSMEVVDLEERLVYEVM